VMREQFGAEESNSVLDHAGKGVQGYRGVDWRTDSRARLPGSPPLFDAFKAPTEAVWRPRLIPPPT
jgi:hypothetical protein